jgi:hypothetical protein
MGLCYSQDLNNLNKRAFDLSEKVSKIDPRLRE